ncbi:unnamed protein product [Acanthoscelides obtectus]|uniref:Centrosomin N-terminal motif 1 domain-containing protein n=1 Tax=Acanthoscelides obtectus TaxID=200917 RepID=A0A9P0P247_ACAOB|nr:unnamed protein product [Acanthoscelides obtectus]CAK1629722.1 hypothetical protein AOBTE_LOCUS5914 [Acanthoscelides obtectus]
MGVKFTFDRDNIVKTNVELQVELANLKKEVQEKHELLCQAARALELEDDEHKKYIASKEQELNMCQQELEELRLQLQLHLEKENNAALQLLVGQIESIKNRNENLTKELREKESIIKHLHDELESANERIIDFARQLKNFEDLQIHLETYKKKYNLARADLERTEKMAERSKASRDVRITELEAEVQTQRAHSQRLQRELEQARSEIHRNQNIAVDNDDRVSNATARQRAQEADVPYVQVERSDSGSSGSGHKRSAAAAGGSRQGGSSVEDESCQPAEKSDQICCDNDTMKNKYSALKLKFLKMKTEQMKACEIIKSMIKARDRSNEEIATLKNSVKGKIAPYF